MERFEDVLHFAKELGEKKIVNDLFTTLTAFANRTYSLKPLANNDSTISIHHLNTLSSDVFWSGSQR
jgi:hypothetical protein